MLRSRFITAAVLACTVGVVSAETTQENRSSIFGKVAEVSPGSLTIQTNGQLLTFVVDANTHIVAKGASHKSKAAAKEKRATVLSDFIKLRAKVNVKYVDVDGRLVATQVRVLASPPS